MDNANVVFNWRRLHSEGKLAVEPAQAMKLLPVSIEGHEVVEPPPKRWSLRACGSIHIELRGKVRISVEGHADPAVIRAVLEVLRGLSTFSRRSRARARGSGLLLV